MSVNMQALNEEIDRSIRIFESAVEDSDNERAHAAEDEMFKWALTAIMLGSEDSQDIATRVLQVSNAADYER